MKALITKDIYIGFDEKTRKEIVIRAVKGQEIRDGLVQKYREQLVSFGIIASEAPAAPKPAPKSSSKKQEK